MNEQVMPPPGPADLGASPMDDLDDKMERAEEALMWLGDQDYRWKPAPPDSGFDFYVVNSSLQSDERGMGGVDEKMEITQHLKSFGCQTNNPLMGTTAKGKKMFAVFFNAPAQ